MYKGLIPRQTDGSLINWVHGEIPTSPGIHKDHWGTETLWAENIPFEDQIELVNYSRGRSSVTFIWRSCTGPARYETSLAEGFDMIKDLKDMKYRGKFVFVKRGQNYLMERFTEEE